jgi:hypothetical protein
MRNRFSYFILATVFAIVAAIAAVVYMTEYTKTGKCYRTDSILSAEEMRARVYRSLLATEVLLSAEESTDKLDIKTFLIPKSLTKKEMIDAIETKSIVNLPKQSTYPLNSRKDAESLDSKFLSGEFSVVAYGLGYVRITPSNGLTAVSFDDAKKYLDGGREHSFVLNYL